MAFNKVIVQGNLTRDPEVRTLPSGSSVARLAVAVNRTFNDKDGNKKEEVTYVDVDAFGKQADTIGKFFTKGKPILIEGRLKLDNWEDKTTGEKKSRLGVVLEGFSFVGGNAEKDAGDGEAATHASTDDQRRDSAHARPQGKAAPKQSSLPGAHGSGGYGEEDIPF